MKVKPLEKVRFSERELTFIEKLKRALPNVINLDEFRGRRGRRGARGVLGESVTGEVGSIGPRGRAGSPGPVGRAGNDGVAGERGKRGVKGIYGRAGEVGPIGPPGAKGDIGPMPRHKWDGTRLSFEKPNGTFGRSVELRGPGGGRSAARVTGGSMANVQELFNRARSIAYFLGE